MVTKRMVAWVFLLRYFDRAYSPCSVAQLLSRLDTEVSGYPYKVD